MRASHLLTNSALRPLYTVEEVPQNMYCVSSVIEYIILEVSQNIQFFTFSVTLVYNGIFLNKYLNTHALECIFRETWP